MVARAVFCILFLPVWLGACDALVGTRDRVAIQVGKHRIRLSMVQEDIEALGNDMGLSEDEIRPVFDHLVDRLLERYLLLAYGEDHRITVQPVELGAAIREIKDDYASESQFQEMLLERYVDFESWKEHLREQLLLRKIIDKGMEAVQPVPFQEIQRYYDQHQDTYRRPAMVRYRQIIAGTSEEAEAILEQANKGEGLKDLIHEKTDTFEQVVVMPERWTDKSELEETFAKALFDLPLGLSKKPVRTPYGFHVIEITEKRPAGVQPLPEVVKDIERRLTSRNREIFYQRWLDELKTQYPVQVDRDVINQMEIG
jgi:parvulin-like peptidyl-prolyl isomerase